MNEPRKLAYNVPEAARAIGVSRATLFARIKTVELPSFMACGRRLIWADELTAFLRSAEAASATRASTIAGHEPEPAHTPERSQHLAR